MWGRGFQYDRFSASSNAQPVDLQRRLPFNSEFLQPFSSGLDALAQNWRGFVNWCNPPFVLVSKVFALLRAQRAVAAMVVPLNAKQQWSEWALPGAEGVVDCFVFDPTSARLHMVGAPPCSYHSGFAVVFLDFRTSVEVFVDSPSAEQLRAVQPAVALRSDPLLFCRAGGSSGALDWQSALSVASGASRCPSFLR